MSDSYFRVPEPVNEPSKEFRPMSPEKASLIAAIEKMKSSVVQIPAVIGGKEIITGDLVDCFVPHERSVVVARYNRCGEREAKMAVEAALSAKKSWEDTPFEQRSAVFLKAAELICGPCRDEVNAAAMLGMSKTVLQSDADAVCATADFLRYAAHSLQALYDMQPKNSKGVYNRMDMRPLEGFVFAATPFNFLSIAANLPCAPAVAGNTVIWKPASSAVFPAYVIMRILVEAGLPPGVINFVPGSGAAIGGPALASENLAGIHFTGSTEVFRQMWTAVGSRIATYKNYPRLVGETGGKDFVVVHSSADIREAATGLIRGAFEYQGQKCSAASRAYVSSSIWGGLKEELVRQLSVLKMGSVEDFSSFMSAVIDAAAFKNISSYIEHAIGARDEYELVFGGGFDDSKGYFIEPTVFVSKDPRSRLMSEEIFGPVLALYIYDDENYEEALELCDATSPYGLTGSVFARDRFAIASAEKALRHAAGNFFINDKPSGVMAGHQPFGGARASGTNDKSGTIINMLKWVSPRAIKENLCPPKDFRYPCM